MEQFFPLRFGCRKKMHLLHGKNRANLVCRSRRSNSSHADMLRCWMLLGSRWKRPHDDEKTDDGYTRRNRHQKNIFSQINGWSTQQKGIVTLTCDASMYRKSCAMMDHRLEDFCEILWNPFEPQKKQFFSTDFISHMLHVWYIYHYLPTKLGDFFWANVGKYM